MPPFDRYPNWREIMSDRPPLPPFTFETAIEKIRLAVADIGICANIVEMRVLEVFPFRRDHPVTVVRADHPSTEPSFVHFADALNFDHVGLFAASSIYLTSPQAAKQAGRVIRMRVQVAGFDVVSLITSDCYAGPR
jgi:hypothetical protein